MTLCYIYAILLSRDTSGKTKNPIEKGKPFERMGPRLRQILASPGQSKLCTISAQRRLDKALEPKGPEDLWLSAAKREMVEVLK